MLSNKAITEYQQLYTKHYGYVLSFDEAKEYANDLLDFVGVLLKKDCQISNEKKYENKKTQGRKAK